MHPFARTFHFFATLLLASVAVMSAAQPGAPDVSFDPGSGANSTVYAIAMQGDRILIGGDFTTMDGAVRGLIARLEEDGELDGTFDPGSGFSGGAFPTVLCMIPLPEDKVLVSGAFTEFAGVERSGIARLNADGSLDTSFDPGSGSSFGHVTSTALAPDGNVVLAGGFSSYNGIPRDGLARIHADGTLDPSFDPAALLSGYSTSALVQPDGRILVAISRDNKDLTTHANVHRLNADGTLDPAFNIGSGSTGGFTTAIRTMALQPDGKILLGGTFGQFHGVNAVNLIRLNADGTVDLGFSTVSGPEGRVEDLAVQPDGRILLAGQFTTFAGYERRWVARTQTNGELDLSFDPGEGANSYLYSVALQGADKALLGGPFATYAGADWSKIARIHCDQGTAMRASIAREQELSISPNPATQQIVIRTSLSGLVHAVIVDGAGRCVRRTSRAAVHDQGIRLEVDDLPAGTYLLSIQSSAGVQRGVFVRE